MSWWRTGQDDDVIGDVSADDVSEALDAIVKARRARGEPNLTLPALLDAIAAALRLGAETLFPDLSGNAIRRVVAHLSDGRSIEGGGSRPADGEAVGSLMRAFNDCAILYTDVLDRPARPSELVANVAFCIGARPSVYLVDMDGVTIDSLAVVIDDASVSRGVAPAPRIA